MTRTTRLLTALALAAVTFGSSAPAAAQTTIDTLRVGLFWRSNTPNAFIAGARFARAEFVRVGPDSSPASTAAADSIPLHAMAIRGFTEYVEIRGSSSASNAKQVVVRFTAAGATTTIDSLQLKTGGGNWQTRCVFAVRNAVPTTDSTQVVTCSHLGSADSSTTSTAAPLTMTLKMIPSATTNYFSVRNTAGTAKGDIIVQLIRVEDLAGGRVNP